MPGVGEMIVGGVIIVVLLFGVPLVTRVLLGRKKTENKVQ